jgi:uncharacterized protein
MLGYTFLSCMKVAVLFSPGDRPHIIPILNMFQDLAIQAKGFGINSNWQSVTNSELTTKFRNATHFFILFSSESLEAGWLSFAAGYSLGREVSVMLYRVESGIAIPGYLSAMLESNSIEAAETYYREQKRDWREKRERAESRRILLERGISFHADSFTKSLCEGDLESIKLFLAAGMNANSRDKTGVPALIIAVRNRRPAIVQFLAKAGADINAVSADRGYSALMEAVRLGNLPIARFLVGNGADLEVRSKDGQTAIILAVGHGDADMAAFLMKAGANPDTSDALGLSARKYAALLKDDRLRKLMAV